MNKDQIAQYTRDYLAAIADASDFVYVDSETQIALTQVHVMLEAFQIPSGKRPEVAPTDSRTESTGIEKDDSITKDEKKTSYSPPPIPIQLSQALRENQYLVLLGEPGAGKTTTLQFVGLCFANEPKNWANEMLETDEKRIPIRLILQNFADTFSKQGSTILNALINEVASRLSCKEEIAHELIEDWNGNGELLILLDGLDETRAQHEIVVRQIRNFANAPVRKDVRIIVSSRLVGFAALGNPFKEYVIKPLEKPEEAEAFVRGWLEALQPGLGEQSKKLVETLSAQPALRRLINNPLILRLAAEQFARSGKIAQDRAELYASYANEAWQRAISRDAKEEEKELAFQSLEIFAWHIQMSGKGSKAEVENAFVKYKIVSTQEKAGSCLRLIRDQMGLVIYVQERLVFSHTTFHEYFVAQRLKRIWVDNEINTWNFLRYRLHLPYWREPLLLLASILDEVKVKKLITKVRLAKSRYEFYLKRDFVLSATLIGESKIKDKTFIQPYVKASRNFFFPKLLAIEALCKIGSLATTALVEMLDILKHKNPFKPSIQSYEKEKDKSDVFMQSLNALIGVGQQEIFLAIIRNLSERHYSDRSAAVDLLAQSNNPQLFEALIFSITSDDNKLRELAADIIGKIDHPKFVPVLIQVLKDYDGKWDLASAFQKIRNPQIVPALVQGLADAFNQVRGIAGALYYYSPVPDSRIIAEGNLAFNFVTLIHRVIEVLGEIGDPSAVPTLIDALKYGYHSNYYLGKGLGFTTNQYAIWALGKLGDDRAVPALIDELNNIYLEASKDAARALGKIGDPQAIPALIQIVKYQHDDDPDDEFFNNRTYVDARKEAAMAIAAIGGDGARVVLNQALDDENVEVRNLAASALLVMKKSLSSEPYLPIQSDNGKSRREEFPSDLVKNEYVEDSNDIYKWRLIDRFFLELTFLRGLFAISIWGIPSLLKALLSDFFYSLGGILASNIIKALQYSRQSLSKISQYFSRSNKRSGATISSAFRPLADFLRRKVSWRIPVNSDSLEVAGCLVFGFAVLLFIIVKFLLLSLLKILLFILKLLFFLFELVFSFAMFIGEIFLPDNLFLETFSNKILRLPVPQRPRDAQYQAGIVNRVLTLKLAKHLLVGKPYSIYMRDDKYLMVLLERFETLLVPTFDPTNPIGLTRSSRIFRWLGFGTIAGLFFGLVGVLSKILDNTQSYIFVGIFSMIVGFLGWILDEIRDKMKNKV